MITMRTLVVVALSASPLAADEARVREAIDKGLARLSDAARNYPAHRDCFSCHHQALPVMAFESARRRGISVSELGVSLQIRFTVQTFRPNLDSIAKGSSVPGSNTTVAYALHTLQTANYPGDNVTDALVRFLLARQTEEGTWPATTNRPPTEGSKFTNAALALSAFRHYGPGAGDKSDAAKELRPRIAQATRRARDWIEKNEPQHTEDAVFRLRALVEAESAREKIDAAREALIRMQKDSGGWAQLPDKEADAYATGSALMALRAAGTPVSDKVYVRGIKYLLDHQDASGAWLVTTRSRPVQALFDNGDPGGKSQFITIPATGWAVLALLETLPARK